MLKIRKSSDRGHFDHGWLNTYHTFSFDQYRDPHFDHFSVLRVINEDTIAAGEGFPTHGHRDMEIITYVVDGALAHKDTLGTQSTINPGDMQRMTAGTGIKHSEFNKLEDKPTHLLQIWILPAKPNEKPSYAQKSHAEAIKSKNFLLVAGAKETDSAISINQDVEIYAGKTKIGDKIEKSLINGRKAWLQLIDGELDVNGSMISKGDGLAVTDETLLKIQSVKPSHFLYFDLP